MKKRLFVSASAVALSAGVVAAPVADSVDFTDGLKFCVNSIDAAMARVKADGKSGAEIVARWDKSRFERNIGGSSAPGDSFSYCMESALSSQYSWESGPA